jgi:hypothetical protein
MTAHPDIAAAAALSGYQERIEQARINHIIDRAIRTRPTRRPRDRRPRRHHEINEPDPHVQASAQVREATNRRQGQRRRAQPAADHGKRILNDHPETS